MAAPKKRTGTLSLFLPHSNTNSFDSGNFLIPSKNLPVVAEGNDGGQVPATDAEFDDPPALRRSSRPGKGTGGQDRRESESESIQAPAVVRRIGKNAKVLPPASDETLGLNPFDTATKTSEVCICRF